MNRKSHFPNHILPLYESALQVVSEAFLGLSPHLFFSTSFHFQYPPAQGCGRAVACHFCCEVLLFAKKCDIQLPPRLISIHLAHRDPAGVFSQVFNRCSALSLPSSSPAGAVALRGNQEVA